MQDNAAITTSLNSPGEPSDHSSWKCSARCPRSVHVLWCHVAIWHPLVKKFRIRHYNSSVLSEYMSQTSLVLPMHTEKSRKEVTVAQGQKATHLDMANLNPLPYFTEARNFRRLFRPFSQLGHQQFLSGDQERIFLLWHTVWQQWTLFLFSFETRETWLQLWMGRHAPVLAVLNSLVAATFHALRIKPISHQGGVFPSSVRMDTASESLPANCQGSLPNTCSARIGTVRLLAPINPWSRVQSSTFSFSYLGFLRMPEKIK